MSTNQASQHRERARPANPSGEKQPQGGGCGFSFRIGKDVVHGNPPLFAKILEIFDIPMSESGPKPDLH